MYRFKSGQFKNMQIECVMLRYAPALYRLVDWAEDKPHLARIVRDFNRLRAALRRAPVRVACAGRNCKRQPKWMTLPLDYNNDLLPSPYFWCDKHDPGEEVTGITQKLAIHFDVQRLYPAKRDQNAIHHSVLRALGIKKASRVTERFAITFFDGLSQFS